jgi:futalosine hydrolase
MKILIVSATELEIMPFLEHLDEKAKKLSFFDFEIYGHSLVPLVTGVGGVKTAFALATFLDIRQVDLVINVGLAGAVDKTIALGSVVQVSKDRFGDIGVEDEDGSFIDVFQLGLENADKFPFSNGWLINEKNKNLADLPSVSSISYNMVSGSSSTINARYDQTESRIESMEGASLAYACRCMDVAYLQMRAISNYVEPRNRNSWQINLAVDNLSAALIDYLEGLKK